MRSSQRGRTHCARGTTPIKLAAYPTKKSPPVMRRGPEPASLVQIQPGTPGDIFYLDNGGSSGTGYSVHFRPATQRTIQRWPAGKALSLPCSLYRRFSAYSSSSQSFDNFANYTSFSPFVNTPACRLSPPPNSCSWNLGEAGGGWADWSTDTKRISGCRLAAIIRRLG